jgi:hypothetical protein
MPCCIAAVAALIGPRLALVLMFFFTNYLQRAFDSWIWPLLGFFFLPLTTIVYAWAISTHGSIEGLYLIAVIVAALLDLGIIGGAGRSRRGRS